MERALARLWTLEGFGAMPRPFQHSSSRRTSAQRINADLGFQEFMQLLSFIKRVYDFTLAVPQKLSFALENYIESKTQGLAGPIPKNRRRIISELTQTEGFQKIVSNPDEVKKATRYLKEIAANTTYLTTPFWDLLITWVLNGIYDGLDVDVSALEKIKAQLGKTPVIFAPNHESHMDYVLMSYLLYHHKIPLPYVCAGDNMNLWGFGVLFRASGAFFIRRSFKGHKLYAASLYLYLQYLMREKAVMEFFIEGGRSRTGKLLSPKMGMLSLFMQTHEDRTCQDIAIVPTSISYESIIEGEVLVAERKGQEKKKETFWDIFKLRKYLRKKYGKVYVRFSEPISVKDFLKLRLGLSPREQTQDLAYEITYGINKNAVVTPGSLAAAILLAHSKKVMTIEQMEGEMLWLLKYLRHKQAPLSQTLIQNPRQALREAVSQFVKSHFLIHYKDDEGYFYAVNEHKRHSLDIYKNHALHFFVSLSVCARILINTEQGLTKEEMGEEYLFFQKLLKYEFHFGRRQGREEHIQKVLDFLLQEKLLELVGDQYQVSGAGKIILPRFSALLVNFLESAMITWKGLEHELGKNLEEKECLKILQHKGPLLYLKGVYKKTESLSRDNLQNALKVLSDEGVLTSHPSWENWGLKLRKYLPYIAIH